MSATMRAPKEPTLWLPESSWPLIPEGKYKLGYRSHDYFTAFGKRPKLAIEFSILDFGPYFEVVVTRFYNVEKQGRNYRAPKNGDLNREFATLFGKQPVRRGLNWERLAKSIILGQVRTVKRSANQRRLSSETEYSVVSELLKVVD